MDSFRDLIVAKSVAMSVLGICSFLVGILPIKLSKLMKIKTGGENNLLISLLLCFGGGVLLFTTFIHLQPEVRDSFEKLESTNRIPSFGIPVSELVFCFGFFFVYLVEELVHFFLDKKLKNVELRRSLSVRCHTNSAKENMSIPRVALGKPEEGNIAYIYSSNKELYNAQSTENNSGHSHSHSNIDGAIKNSFGGLLAVLALSFHAVFEGLAVGLENRVQKVWYLFAAIATHKLVIGFCVGMELVSSKTKVALILSYIGTFAIVTPLGIGAGIALSASGRNEEDVTSIILQGMAAGTLLYVVFFEVLAREKNNRHSGIWQLIAITAGFAVMFALQLATGHSHSHSHNETSSETTTTHSH